MTSPTPEQFSDNMTSEATSHQSPDEVVVSGISCRLPQSENMQEFRDNLMYGIDMVTEDNSRWPPGLYGFPRRHGKLKDLTRFDAAFFGVHPKQANRMDPQLRMLLEVSYEAIVDAGVNPETVRGSRTGVFVGCSGSECRSAWTNKPENVVGYVVTGCANSMFANRVSFFFDFKGPSFALDTACSTSLLGMDRAIRSIRSGECDAAIVAGTQLCLSIGLATAFTKLNMLSPEGMCKAFDKDGNGYCRSEGIVAIYLQKQPGAKRIYCTAVHSKTCCDGYKENGVTFPSGATQTQLLREVYAEAGINPATVAYIEAHGTGTKVGDPTEGGAICDVFCKDREGPLLIGSVKSNLGHTEVTSGLTGLAKVIVAIVEGSIPGNLHFNEPNPDIPGLLNGQLKVNDRTSPWNGGLVGINSFGFGGTNVHVILKSNPIEKRQPVETSGFGHTNTNKRLLMYAANTEEGLKTTLEEARKHPDDEELHALLHETANMSITSHPYRGFTILNSEETVHIQRAGQQSRPVWFAFTGMGCQWPGMGKKMMEIEGFRTSILKSGAVLKPYNINLYEMLVNADQSTYDSSVTNAFIGIVTIQIALVDVLTKMGIKPDGIFGHSIGEIACAYADGCLTSEEAILTAYWRGQCVEQAGLPPGAMAAVGLSWEEAVTKCPEDVVAACHNAVDLVTISGGREAVRSFSKVLEAEGTFAREVNSAGVAFHSPHMKPVGVAFQAALKKVITCPRPRTARWVSSSVPEDQWDSDLAKWASAEYYTNNVVSPVLCREALLHVPDNAIVIEVSPYALLRTIIKRSCSKNCLIIGLMTKRANEKNNVEFFLTNLGKCYTDGMTLNPSLLSPVRYPVSRSTPMISPMLRWDHSQTWDVATYDQLLNDVGNVGDLDMSADGDDRYLTGHVIDGRVLFPASGYLVLAWKQLALLNNKDFEEMSVSFQDVEFLRATVLPNDGKVHFDVSVQQGTGRFEIHEGGALVSTGHVFVVDEWAEDAVDTKLDVVEGRETTDTYVIQSEDIYKALRLCGCDYSGEFAGIKSFDVKGNHGRLKWTGHWIPFIDTMLQIFAYTFGTLILSVPTKLDSMLIDPKVFKAALIEKADGTLESEVRVHLHNKTRACNGIIFKGGESAFIKRRQVHGNPMLDQHKFVSYLSHLLQPYDTSLQAYFGACSARAREGLSNLLELHGNNGLQNKDEIKAALDHIANNVPDTSNPDAFQVDENLHRYLVVLNEMFDKDIAFTEEARGIIKQNDIQLKSDPLLCQLFSSDVLAPCIDLVGGNMLAPKLRVMELCNTTLLQHVMPFVETLPRHMPIFTCASRGEIDHTNIEQLQWSLSDKYPESAKRCHLLIASNVLHKQPNITEGLLNMLECVEEGGFILIHEQTNNFHIALPLDGMWDHMSFIEDPDDRSCGRYCTEKQWEAILTRAGMEIIYQRSDAFMSTVFLVRKRSELKVEKQIVVDVACLDYTWLETLKSEMERIQTTPKDENLWLFADSDVSGLLGMMTCLRLEPGGEKIRCIVNLDQDAKLDIAQCMPDLCQRDLVMNVYKDGKWGTYSHIPLNPVLSEDTEHAFVNVMNRGDLSSVRWVRSALSYSKPGANIDLCRVHYAALNFRDVMLATGKLTPFAIPGVTPAIQDNLYGMEFSGYNSRGERVMGLVAFMGLATSVEVRKDFLWPVPESWTLEQAATVMCVYTTAYYALVVRGNLRQGDTVLIHSGTGGVGQAAISIALHRGCDVFTTVGSFEKRMFLKQRFPQIKDDRIFNSRNTKFEMGIIEITKGKGVDVVLNSLAGEKLQASLRILAKHGRFLEIGKVDLSQNTALGMSLFLKNVSFHGILLDSLFEEGNREWEMVSRHLDEGIQAGVVQPLQTSVFERDNVEAAFRYMAKGKHIGKVLVKVQDGECGSETPIPALPRTFFHPDKCYIITGGLGGVGMELTTWMCLRGARYLVLTSRTGVTTGFHKRRIADLQKLGVEVIISTRNVCSLEDTEALVTETNGKPVGGIFHLAMVLKDGYLESQDLDTFHTVCDPKVFGVTHLDAVTRQRCKETCDWFVVFSSQACGRGNAGQSLYGFGNSVMERVCEQRKQSGLHALAIQWGAIDEAGSAWRLTQGVDGPVSIVGTRHQRLSSVFEALDTFMCQGETIVSSMVPAVRQNPVSLAGGPTDLVHAVCNVLGITDPSTVDADAFLSNIGLDSMMNTEVQHVMEHFEMSLTIREIRQLTFNKMRNMVSGKKDSENNGKRDSEDNGEKDSENNGEKDCENNEKKDSENNGKRDSEE